MHKIPVFSGPRVIELADEARARHLLKAPNATAVIRRRDKQVVQINLSDCGADRGLTHPKGNPRRYSHANETDQNPARCWTLRHIPTETAPIFDAVLASCLKEAA